MSLSVVPPEAWKSSEITKLDLSRNSIEELPVELSSCVSLEVTCILHIPLFYQKKIELYIRETLNAFLKYVRESGTKFCLYLFLL